MKPSILILPLLLLLAGCGPPAPAILTSHAASQVTSSLKNVSAYTSAELQSLDPGSSLGGKPAPNFTLTDQFGKSVSLHSFKGKAVVLSFDDDECTTICPLTGQILLQAQQALGPASSQVVLLAVNANPDHTSVNDVKAYSIEHGMMNHWLFLTGSKTALEKVWKAYHLEVQITNGSIDHTPAVFVIGPNGHEQNLYLTSSDYGVVPLEAEPLAKAIAKTLPNHPAVKSLPQVTGGAISSPSDKVSLPRLMGGDKVQLGGSSPQLVVFFASWAPDTAAHLAGLNAYATAAKAEHLPPLTAVDVMSTEPSLAQAQAVMKGMASPPTYPVVMDETGRVADAYNVQDIPWITLVKGGKVIWHHDGWVSSTALQKDVAKALGS